MIVLLTGGSGLLGKELLKIDPSLIAPTRAELNITDYRSIEKAAEKYKPDVILHAAAETHPPAHETNPELGIAANIIGTANIARACIVHEIKLVYISSDYVYTGKGPHKENEPLLPPSKFIWSKLGGECSVMMTPNSLILRLSFGPRPFPWEKVYQGQWNSKLYVDEMAPLILAAATSKATGIMNIGGPRTTLEAYARKTRPDIQTIPKPEWVPEDTSLDLAKMAQHLAIPAAEEQKWAAENKTLRNF